MADIKELLRGLSRTEAEMLYHDVLQAKDKDCMVDLCKHDLYFLLRTACNRADASHDWLYDRIREFEADPDGRLDLWARGHYKSTIITFAATIQEILRNPEVTVSIFSHTKPIARAFLRQIQRELEDNEFLKELFPDVLYEHPRKDAPQWSVDTGIVVKRKSNPKEATVEANGLVDGQPTSRHYSLMVYDDVVTLESVSTPDQITKTNQALALSFNLASKTFKRRFIGTRYHFNDTYRLVIERGMAKPRIHRAEDDKGEPMFLPRSELLDKRRDMGVYVYNCQMMQNPTADSAMGFKEDWLMFYDTLKGHGQWNYYILVDPAGAKKKQSSDYTVMMVVALAPDNNCYVIDMVRDRLNLAERTRALFDLHRKYAPSGVGYEQYGMQSDIEHIQGEMEKESYRFNITELGGSMPKEDRIRRLVPKFEEHRWFLPRRLMYMDWEGRSHDLTAEFIKDEFLAFPVSVHDDMLDCLSRMEDPKFITKFPKHKQLVLRKKRTTTNSKYDVLS